MKKLLLILLIAAPFFSFAQRKNELGTWHYPMTIQVRDTNYRELGYFKFNVLTNTVTARGTYKSSFTFFVNEILIPLVELDEAKRQIVRQIKDDGTIRDTVLYKAAILNYTLIRKKYDWRE